MNVRVITCLRVLSRSNQHMRHLHHVVVVTNFPRQAIERHWRLITSNTWSNEISKHVSVHIVQNATFVHFYWYSSHQNGLAYD